MSWQDDVQRFGVLHRPERVLLVDDDASTREVLTQVLYRRGWGVVPVRDGWEAMEVLRDLSLDFQVVLTDIRMPGITGDLLAQNLRRRHPHLGIVAMTAWPGREVQDACAEAGVDVLLAKPFHSIDALIEAIRIAAARRRSGHRPAVGA